jgi:hypothetical protein
MRTKLKRRPVVLQRRFCNPKFTKFGRIGHPAPLDRKLVRCAGLMFEDRFEGKKWTYRKYEAYDDLWPEVDVWTVQVLLPVKKQGALSLEGYGNQTPVPEEEVPEEVKQYARAELVRLRLTGKVYY